MFDYSERIEDFRDKRVRLSSSFAEKLLSHRKANRDRLITRLPELIKKVTIGEANFRPQGSFAMGTIIQTRFLDEEYDIDDGLVLWKHQFVDDDGNELSAAEVKEIVREALKHHRFNRQPKVSCNCVRVFYADEDEEKHHVDFAVYRRYYDILGNKVRELAGENGWIPSDPTQVNTWLEDAIESRNKQTPGWGTQLRRLIQLLKRFCRSRSDWDMPNGLKLTMLVVECQPAYDARVDVAFRQLLTTLKNRLFWNRVIQNRAHPNQPDLTRTSNDQNVLDLQTRVGEACDQIATLDAAGSNNADAARAVWDWVFKSDGFFAEFDAQRKREEKEKSLLAKAELLANGARTSTLGVIGTVGVRNLPHGFYGEESVE